MDYYDKIINWREYINVNTIKTVINFIITNFSIYILWVTLHYISSHLYIYWCVPGTLFGILMSPFLVPAPHCYGLRWAIYHGGNNIIAMWSIIGIWLLARILPLKPE
jgi:hypothetical protein